MKYLQELTKKIKKKTNNIQVYIYLLMVQKLNLKLDYQVDLLFNFTFLASAYVQGLTSQCMQSKFLWTTYKNKNISAGPFLTRPQERARASSKDFQDRIVKNRNTHPYISQSNFPLQKNLKVNSESSQVPLDQQARTLLLRQGAAMLTIKNNCLILSQIFILFQIARKQFETRIFRSLAGRSTI